MEDTLMFPAEYADDILCPRPACIWLVESKIRTYLQHNKRNTWILGRYTGGITSRLAESRIWAKETKTKSRSLSFRLSGYVYTETLQNCRVRVYLFPDRGHLAPRVRVACQLLHLLYQYTFPLQTTADFRQIKANALTRAPFCSETFA